MAYLAASKTVPANAATAMLLFAALCWGAGDVAQKTVLEHLGPYTANGITCLIASAILWPLCVGEGRKSTPLGPRGLRLMLPISLLFTAAATLSQIGYGGTSVSNASFMVNIDTVLAPFCAWALVGERPPSLIYPALAATLAGTLAMSSFGMTAPAWGDGMCVAAACAYALWLPLVGKFVAAYGRPIFLTAIANLVCGGVCMTIGLIEEPQSTAAYLECLPDLLLLGIVSKAIAFVLMAVAQRQVSSAVAAITVSSESLFGTLFAYLLLSESLGAMAIVGAGLILLGSILVSCASQGRDVSRGPSTFRLWWFACRRLLHTMRPQLTDSGCIGNEVRRGTHDRWMSVRARRA